MIITDEIADVVFRNEENGYSVVRLAGCGLTAVGCFHYVAVGSEFKLTGEYVNNAKYGKQFSVSAYELVPPEHPRKIQAFIGSGLLEGVGPVTAKNIVKSFGRDTLLIMEHNPHELIAVKGISLKKAKSIGEKFANIKQMQAAVMFLQKFEISVNMAVKIFNNYKDKTIQIVQSNPYSLIESIDGIGFITADKMAKELGVDYAGTFRVRAGIVYNLKQSAEQDGNTWLPMDKMRLDVCRLLKIKMEQLEPVFDSVIRELCLDKYLTAVPNGVMLTKFFIAERAVASRLCLLNSDTEKNGGSDLDKLLANYQKINKIQLHEKQIEAIKIACSAGASVITGGPGTGKTTIIKAVLYINQAEGKTTQMLAPTGRAAKRMEEATGHPASTIHRALDIDYKGGGRGVFTYDNEDNVLRADVVIVDEFSMCDVMLTSQMLKKVLRGTRVVFVGDIDQLPSVGAGSVLSEVIESDTVPVVRLTEIYRQTEQSHIVLNAHAINRGEMPSLTNKSDDFFFERCESVTDIKQKIVQLVTTRIPKYLDIPSAKIQVLAPMKAGEAGMNSLNIALQEALNPAAPGMRAEYEYGQTTFREGDRVMQTINNYQQEWTKPLDDGSAESGSGVYNGDIGIITTINRQSGEIAVELEDGRTTTYTRADLANLVLSYAITVHKSQGCEFDVVVIPVTSGAYMILTRNLLYTAVTRAKRMVMLVGDPANLEKMVKNTYTKKRFSMLKEFLVEMKEKTESMFEFSGSEEGE